MVFGGEAEVARRADGAQRDGGLLAAARHRGVRQVGQALALELQRGLGGGEARLDVLEARLDLLALGNERLARVGLELALWRESVDGGIAKGRGAS